MIKHYFIASEKNNYTPKLLNKTALVIYIIVILLFNLLLGKLGVFNLSANITIEQLVQEHNEERIRNGLSPLKLNSMLNESASRKAEVMLNTNCWSHYCPPGQEPWIYFKRAGYNYQYAGENLAEGFKNVDSVISAWMNSETHRENVLNPHFTEIGFGFATGNYQGKSNNLIIAVHFGHSIDTNTLPSANNLLTPENFVTIDNIKNGQVINSDYIEIIGSVKPENSEVKILINDEESGKVNATGPNYTYKTENEMPDGEYTIQSVVSNILDTDIKTPKINVYLDSEAPLLLERTLEAKKVVNKYLLKFYTSTDVDTLNVSISTESISKVNLNEWHVVINENVLNEFDRIRIFLKDESGNEGSYYILTQNILNAGDEYAYIDNYKEETLNVLSSFFTRLGSGGLRQILPIIFIIYLIGLFSFDFFILNKTNMLDKVNRKPHLNISVFLILSILLLLGGVSSNILTGISI